MKCICQIWGKEYDWQPGKTGNDSCRNSRVRCYTCRCRQNSRKIKAKLVDELGGKCSSCGYDKSIAALDFHHTDPTKKEFGVSVKLRYGYTKVLSEAKKCVLLCKNCHAELHFNAMP